MSKLKFTVYKKVSLSRNLLLFIFIACLIAVGGKIALAHQKIATYEEAITLYNAGEMIASEKKFRQAKYNISITDHNKDINRKLSILSPIRKTIEDIDKKVSKANKVDQLEKLVKQYNRYHNHKEKWLSGTITQKDMFNEMIEKTGIESDFKQTFVAIKTDLLNSLSLDELDSDQEEEDIYTALNLIPQEYYSGNRSAEISNAFINYYNKRLDSIKGEGIVIPVVTEGKRQFDMLEKLSIDPAAITANLDPYLTGQLTASMEKEDYSLFATQAAEIKELTSYYDGTLDVYGYIETSKESILRKAERLLANNKYEDAITIYEAIKPLEDTTALIASAELEWDKYEPIRVLKRDNPNIEFTHFINGRNKFGVDSFVAAISATGTLYFGTLSVQEPMKVQQTENGTITSIKTMKFESRLGVSNYPVVLIDAQSSSRKHHYLAYEIVLGSTSIQKILDLDADGFTIESSGRLLVDNDDGQGAGELAYYTWESYYDEYTFDEIKKDYVDISSDEIASYLGQKVRFSESIEAEVPGGVIAEISSEYDYITGQYVTKYVLLKGNSNLSTYRSYTIIGTVIGTETITYEGTSMTVPVVQVEKAE